MNLMKLLNQKEDEQIVKMRPVAIMQYKLTDFLSAYKISDQNSGNETEILQTCFRI